MSQQQQQSKFVTMAPKKVGMSNLARESLRNLGRRIAGTQQISTSAYRGGNQNVAKPAKQVKKQTGYSLDAVSKTNPTGMFSYKKGGTVKKTGPAKLHKGEVVLPKRKGRRCQHSLKSREVLPRQWDTNMPLSKGKSKKTVSKNISEFHKGKTFAHTASKFGKAKANKQAVAVALNTAGKSKKKAKKMPTRAMVMKSLQKTKGYS